MLTLMDKKGDFTFEQIGKILLALAFLIVLILIAFLFKDKLISIIEYFKNIIKFGG